MNWLSKLSYSKLANGLATEISRHLVDFISRTLRNSPFPESDRSQAKRTHGVFYKGINFSESSEMYLEKADFDPVIDQHLPARILVELHFITEDHPNPTGTTGLFTNSDFLSLHVWMPKSTKYINSLIPQLKNTIRHELEHRKQVLNKTIGPAVGSERNVDGLIAYLTAPHEVEAMVSGMKRESDTTGIPLYEVMRNRLGNGMKTRLFDPQEEQKVYDTVLPIWIAESQRRRHKIDVPNPLYSLSGT